MTHRLLVIMGSTRPERAGGPVASWSLESARDHGGFTVESADLAEIDLPFLDEPEHPRLRHYRHEHTRAWSARVESADAFIFVMPEYNYGVPAPVKNALDFLYHEWHHKPVGYVTYGGQSGGLRAGEMFKLVAIALAMTPVAAGVQVASFRDMIEAGRLQPSERMQTSMTAMLAELQRLAVALAPLRASEG